MSLGCCYHFFRVMLYDLHKKMCSHIIHTCVIKKMQHRYSCLLMHLGDCKTKLLYFHNCGKLTLITAADDDDDENKMKCEKCNESTPPIRI